MGCYDPKGKAHRVLERLTRGHAGGKELRRTIDPKNSRHKQEAWRVLLEMRFDGLIRREMGVGYFITQAGRDALICLESGYPLIGRVPPGLDQHREAA